MKRFFLLATIIALLTACEKRGDLPELPTYTSFRMTVSAVERYYEVMVGESRLEDSLSSAKALSRYVVTGKQKLKIKEAGTDSYLVDSLIDVVRPGIEFTLIDPGAGAAPLLLSAKDLSTTPPATGHRKYSLLNIDTTDVLKGRTVDIQFYDLSSDDGSFVLLGEMKNIGYHKISGYVELKDPDAGVFFMQIMDSGTGEIIVPVESYAATMTFPFNEHNVYLMKIENAGGASWTYIAADLLIGMKL